MHGELADVYGSFGPSYALVKFWVGDFKRARTSLEDESRAGFLLDATNEEMCKTLFGIWYTLMGKFVCQALGISQGSFSTISHGHLGMHKLAARWVPTSLSNEKMATRVRLFKTNSVVSYHFVKISNANI